VFSVIRWESRSTVTGLGIHVDVLEHGPEHFGRGVDLRLTGTRQPDDLGVAAALEVEDAGI